MLVTASLLELFTILHSAASMQVRCGLESPEGGTYQQRVGHMRLLGEMYNFRLVDSRYAFHTVHFSLALASAKQSAASSCYTALSCCRRTRAEPQSMLVEHWKYL